MDVRSLIRSSERELQQTAALLASLNEGELASFRAALVQLSAPISDKSIEIAAVELNKKIPRLSMADWSDVIIAVLHFLRDPDFMEFFTNTVAIDPQQRERVQSIVESFRPEKAIALTLDLDRFLDRGPRLTGLTFFCDVRTKFADAEASAEQNGTPLEEAKVPLAIIRLKVDEVDHPVYFQMVESEIADLISKLELARSQLRHLAGK